MAADGARVKGERGRQLGWFNPCRSRSMRTPCPGWRGAPARRPSLRAPVAATAPSSRSAAFCRCGACATPLTASWSRGHGGRYAYCFCRDSDCRRVFIRREERHERLTDHLREVQPTAAAFGLLREAPTRQWQQVEAERGSHSAAARQAIDTARERRARPSDA